MAQDGRTPVVPTVAERVWQAFWRLDARRSVNGYSANAISPSDIDAWCRLNGVTLRIWEVAALDEMERVWLRWLNRDQDEDADVVVQAQPVTPVLVKALFG